MMRARRNPIALLALGLLAGLAAAQPYGKPGAYKVPIRGPEITPIHRPEQVASTARSCRSCHQRLYDEWAGGAHAEAFLSPLFQERWRERRRPESCLQCHAPESVFERGPHRLPESRKAVLEEGVSCISCHRHGSAMVGPHRTPDAAHPTIQDATIRSVGMCASCHDGARECDSDVDGQVHAYLHSPQRARETCQSCHMPATLDTSVSLMKPTYPARRGRSHRMLASRDPEVLRLAAKMDAFVEGKYLQVTLENRTAGHQLPGSSGRALVLVVRFTDRNGLEFDRQHEYLMSRTGTRLRPGENREYRFLLKPRYEGVEAVLYYRLTERQDPRDWVRIDRVGLRLDGRGPLPEPPPLEPGKGQGLPYEARRADGVLVR